MGGSYLRRRCAEFLRQLGSQRGGIAHSNSLLRQDDGVLFVQEEEIPLPAVEAADEAGIGVKALALSTLLPDPGVVQGDGDICFDYLSKKYT